MLMLNIGLLLLWLGLNFVVSGGGAHFGAYLKKKGENLATHEDIDKVLVEVRATTQATKEIEAKISDVVWDRQKRWEMKRDLIFEATKRIAIVKDKLVALCNTYEAGDQTGNPHPEVEAHRKADEQC